MSFYFGELVLGMNSIKIWDKARRFCFRLVGDRPTEKQTDQLFLSCMKQMISVIACVLGLTLAWPFAQPAIASIHAYPQASEQTLFRSLQSLRDQADRSWQLVFFDQVDRGEIKLIHLRLVGFPGLDLARSPLTLTAQTGQRWTAPAVTTAELNVLELPANTAEFDLFEVMRELQGDSVIDLGLDLVSGDRVELTVPVAVVREWRSVLEQR
jgi:hypothetical protein